MPGTVPLRRARGLVEPRGLGELGQLFNGDVLSSFAMSYSCIYIVAGPRACGKSTFIERCRAEQAAPFLPEQVSRLANADGPVYFMDLANGGFADAKELLVHVDLLTPFADLSISSEHDLATQVQAKVFAQYPGVELFKDCSQLKVLTLRVPRITTLRRWLRRSAEQDKKHVSTVTARLYSDAFGEAGYLALYNAWDQYLAELPNAIRWDVSESLDGRSYSVVRT